MHKKVEIIEDKISKEIEKGEGPFYMTVGRNSVRIM